MFLTLDVVKSTALATMYWTVGLSMFQLGISIQVIFEQIDRQQAKKRQTIMYTVVSCFMICYVPVIYIFRMNNFYEARSITDSIVIVVNMFILVFLKYKLAKFKTGEMSAPICSIYTQFFLFLLSFILITTVDFFFGFSAATQSTDFTMMHVIIFLNETIPLIPILYVLYVHR